MVPEYSYYPEEYNLMRITEKSQKLRTLILLVILLLSGKIGQAQAVPLKSFENQKDYSYMWWTNTIKTGNKIFSIKTSRYALSFDYQNLALTSLIVSKVQASDDFVLRETNAQSFPANNPSQIRFGMETEGGMYWCTSSSGNIDDCQLIETGKYFQRRFINKLPDLIGCDVYNTGLEISSWPDRLSFILRVTPTSDSQNRGLEFDFAVPSEYSNILEKGDVKVFKNPVDGSGFIVLKSANATSIAVDGNTVKVKLGKSALWSAGKQISAGLIIYPVIANIESKIAEIEDQENKPVTLTAQQISPTVQNIDVEYDQDHGWHHIALRNDGNTAGYSESSNGRIERVKLVFDNTSSVDKSVRLNFAKGRLSKNGTDVFGVTGISAVLRNLNGDPIGIPIQLSKNWHTSTSPDAIAQPFRGTWFHGLCMLTIPANTKLELEYTSVNALWGSIPAASHAQLCLVGWGSNQQWDESAIGSWGESITYEPDLIQAGAPVLDYRPLMLKTISGQKWGWTGNMGGADFFNYTKTNGTRAWHSRMRTQYKRYSPNLTEVTYAGTMDDNSMDFEYTASIYRSDDITRGIYHIKLNVLNTITFKDFVFFQAAAPTYHYTKSNTLAWGNETGLKKQWSASIGGASRYITSKQEAEGKIPWFSFTDSQFAGAQPDFRPANRGFVIRSWKAKINGKDNSSPSFAEFNATGGHGEPSCLINITPPADCTSFQTGDYIEAEIELFQIPKSADDYYGPNQNLIVALSKKANTWEMAYREATGNDLDVIASSGAKLINKYPVKIESNSNSVYFSVSGGRGYVPITITNVSNYSNPALYHKVNGSWQKINQSVYGNDFWQADYNALTGKWDITYNVNLDSPNDARQTVEFKFESTDITNANKMPQKIEPGLKVYPNPTESGNFSIEFENMNHTGQTKVKIVDIYGRSVFERDYLNERIIQVQTNLPTGAYIVFVNVGQFINSSKLIIQ